MMSCSDTFSFQSLYNGLIAGSNFKEGSSWLRLPEQCKRGIKRLKSLYTIWFSYIMPSWPLFPYINLVHIWEVKCFWNTNFSWFKKNTNRDVSIQAENKYCFYDVANKKHTRGGTERQRRVYVKHSSHLKQILVLGAIFLRLKLLVIQQGVLVFNIWFKGKISS